jgi:hypothetical protein
MIKRIHISPEARDTFVIVDIQASSIADKVIGIVPVKCELVKVMEAHGTAGSDGGAVTLSIERLQGTETSSNGDQVVAATINLKGTANTVQTGTIVKTSNIHQFAAGDRVGVNVTGTTTSLATMVVSCQFRPID